METSSIGNEIQKAIEEILKARGINESRIDFKAHSKSIDAQSGLTPGAGGAPIVEWPRHKIILHKMRISIDYALPDLDDGNGDGA